jgi:membrane protease YdiL (CAAX protease family)
MAAYVVAEPRSTSHSAIASYWHTAFILLVAGILAYRGMVRAGQVRALVNPDRISIYTRTMIFEWLVLGLVLAGVWLHGSSIRTVFGERWRSIKQFLLDIGIGVAFMMISVPAASFMGSLLPGGGNEKASQFILPQGHIELALWVALSISAGICEEAVYRGYFLRQFTALTRSAPAGIVLAGVLFGAAHSYLGLSQAIQIAFLGTMSGILAVWRRSVRPGMIAHALQDILGAVIRH